MLSTPTWLYQQGQPIKIRPSSLSRFAYSNQSPEASPLPLHNTGYSRERSFLKKCFNVSHKSSFSWETSAERASPLILYTLLWMEEHSHRTSTEQRGSSRGCARTIYLVLSNKSNHLLLFHFVPVSLVQVGFSRTTTQRNYWHKSDYCRTILLSNRSLFRSLWFLDWFVKFNFKNDQTKHCGHGTAV